jgi:hypothetical protein
MGGGGWRKPIASDRNCRSWASASRPMSPASAFWHSATQSDTGAFWYRTGFPYSGTGLGFFHSWIISTWNDDSQKNLRKSITIHMAPPRLERRKNVYYFVSVGRACDSYTPIGGWERGVVHGIGNNRVDIEVNPGIDRPLHIRSRVPLFLSAFLIPLVSHCLHFKSSCLVLSPL